MGLFGKLFKRGNDDLGLGLDKPSYRPMSEDELGLPELGRDSFSEPSAPADDEEPGISPLRSYPPPRPMPPRSQSQQPGMGSINPSSRDVDLILSKLDSIRSILTTLDMRISNLERSVGIEEKQQTKGYRW
jgi:hypothetical protein